MCGFFFTALIKLMHIIEEKKCIPTVPDLKLNERNCEERFVSTKKMCQLFPLRELHLQKRIMLKLMK